jgi:hypothetical protein
VHSDVSTDDYSHYERLDLSGLVALRFVCQQCEATLLVPSFDGKLITVKVRSQRVISTAMSAYMSDSVRYLRSEQLTPCRN